MTKENYTKLVVLSFLPKKRIFFWYRCHYPHMLRDAVSSICGIFSVWSECTCNYVDSWIEQALPTNKPNTYKRNNLNNSAAAEARKTAKKYPMATETWYNSQNWLYFYDFRKPLEKRGSCHWLLLDGPNKSYIVIPAKVPFVQNYSYLGGEARKNKYEKAIDPQY